MVERSTSPSLTQGRDGAPPPPPFPPGARHETVEHFEAMRHGKAGFFSQDAPYHMNLILPGSQNEGYAHLTTEWKANRPEPVNIVTLRLFTIV